jgi:hypothetical protein
MTKWLLVLALGTPMAAHALTADERACQAGRGRAVYDMIAAEGGCIRRCRGHAAADCMPPDGAGVARCLARARTRALRTVLGAACRRDCPACYGGCGPEVASGEVDYSSGLVTTFASIVYCAPAPTPAESRCTQRVARAAGGFAHHYGRCFVRCHGGGCDGAGPGDARAMACAARAASRAASLIDAGCATPPACHGGLSGAAWVDLVRAAVDHGRPVIFCGSPSGAFVDR